MSIVNVPITVLDFETGIKTANGSDRYIVMIEKDGEKCKFFTNSFTLKSILDEARVKDCLPQKTVLRQVNLGGGKADYTFE